MVINGPLPALARGERQLTLLRHAKSSWAEPGLKDADRPLNERGERDAPAMGRYLAHRSFRPTLFLTSPAVRARRTAQVVAREIGYPAEFLQREPDLYLACVDRICEVVMREAGTLRDVVVCGHNPGLSELAARLGGDDQELPTCGLLVVRFTAPDWSLLEQPGSARVMVRMRPRELPAEFAG
jgi:phosphohistidine phosphatase